MKTNPVRYDDEYHRKKREQFREYRKRKLIENPQYREEVTRKKRERRKLNSMVPKNYADNVKHAVEVIEKCKRDPKVSVRKIARALKTKKIQEFDDWVQELVEMFCATHRRKVVNVMRHLTLVFRMYEKVTGQKRIDCEDLSFMVTEYDAIVEHIKRYQPSTQVKYVHTFYFLLQNFHASFDQWKGVLPVTKEVMDAHISKWANAYRDAKTNLEQQAS